MFNISKVSYQETNPNQSFRSVHGLKSLQEPSMHLCLSTSREQFLITIKEKQYSILYKISVGNYLTQEIRPRDMILVQ